jgi:hypothetical protein
MSLTLPICSAHEPWKERPGGSPWAPRGIEPLCPTGRAALRLWRAFARWQVQRLERRIAALRPDDSLLH